MNIFSAWTKNNLLIKHRWTWHLLFWTGYALFRFYVYYITVQFYPRIFLEYMLISELMFVFIVYFTIWLYRRLFVREKYLLYFIAGTIAWMAFLYGRTYFQFYYLKSQPGFDRSRFSDMVINNITIIMVYFLFITACKYFKDGYIKQQFEAETKRQQLLAEVNNLKSQIAPHFLFNTLNNLYGLAVEKSDKLPDLMLRLSDLLRHSLYETQKPLVPLNEELAVLQSYIDLESVRLEDDLQIEFNNHVPADARQVIAPLILIVFIENAFKHAKLVSPDPVTIFIETSIGHNWFTMMIRNNYNTGKPVSSNGIGIANVKRRLEVLYPNWQHQLSIEKNEEFYIVNLGLELSLP